MRPEENIPPVHKAIFFGFQRMLEKHPGRAYPAEALNAFFAAQAEDVPQ